MIENLVARWTGKRAAGAKKIRAELQKRGAPDELIEESLGAVTSEASHVSMLDALRAKFKPGDDRARAARFLLSRGFAEDEIEPPLDEYFGGE